MDGYDINVLKKNKKKASVSGIIEHTHTHTRLKAETRKSMMAMINACDKVPSDYSIISISILLHKVFLLHTHTHTPKKGLCNEA